MKLIPSQIHTGSATSAGNGAAGGQPARANGAAPAGNPAGALDLQRFLPYRLSVLTNTVSSALARTYATRFDMSVPEWRVMAVLGHCPGLSANEVAERAAMDKVMVSRAVSRLLESNRVERAADPDDRRRKSLRLSAEGCAIYLQIVPLANAYRDALAAALSPEEQATLDRLLTLLQERASLLNR